MNRTTGQPGVWRPILVAAGVLSFLLVSLWVAIFSDRQYTTLSTQAANAQAQVLAHTVTAALSFGDQKALREYVGALEANREVEAVGVFDDRGRLVASYARTRIADTLGQTLSPTSTPNRIIVTASVEQGGARLGTIYLRYRAEPLLRRASRYVGPALLILMALATFMIMTLNARTLAATNRDLMIQIKEREKAEAALRQSQKMEAIGRLTGGIAHDFNNMLAIVLGSLDLLVRRHPDADPQILYLIGQAKEGGTRAAVLTQRLLAFSRLQPLKPTSSDIAKAVTNMTELLRRTLGEAITIETITAGGLWNAHIDLPQLEIAIVNLAINARDAMPQGGKLSIETGNTFIDSSYANEEQDLAPGHYVMLAITDTGTGIQPEVMEKIFEPFFTTKPTGLGTGLGLSQVHGFVKQSGGHVQIVSELGVGTTVRLYLPRSQADPQQTAPIPQRRTTRHRRNVTVLVVEDESSVREFVVEALVDLGYDVIAAEGSKSALEHLESNPAIAVLLTDVVMPDTNGRVLADTATRRRPGLRVIFMTGYTRNVMIQEDKADARTRLLTKPFTIDQLGVEMDSILSDNHKSTRPN